MNGKTQQLIGAMAAAMVAAALLAGGAQADRPDDRAGMIGVGSASAVAVPDAFERAVNNAGTVAGPDAFERALNNALAATSVRPDDRATVRGPGLVASPLPATPAIGSSDGFQWSDASVGAGATFVLLLLGAAIAMTRRHRSRVILS